MDSFRDAADGTHGFLFGVVMNLINQATQGVTYDATCEESIRGIVMSN